jgi:UDP-N-acetylglucosamine:LPS N-acetylglucosamine transferase
MVALGEGGHTKEMLTLVDMLGDDLEYGYIIVEDDEVSEAKIRRPGKTYRVLRPRDKKHNLLGDLGKTAHSAWQSWRALRAFRPQAVLSSGPSVAVPVCILARVMGIKVIFVETGSRVTALSMTGRMMYRVANLFIVQWPELAERCPRAVYAGRLF